MAAMRIWNPDLVYFVTNRCEQERLFLLPKPAVLKLIGAWLAKSLAEHGDSIEIYAFIFLSNHFHILLRDPKGQLAEFMWFFQLNLAKAVNRQLGRSGHFFSREYDAAPVLTDDDLENRYAYILTNAVKARLVSKARSAPFFSSLGMALENRSLEFDWEDRTWRHNKTRRGQTVARIDAIRKYTLTLSVPPMWRAWSDAQRRRRIEGLVAVNEERYEKERRTQGRGVLGVRGIFSQSPLMRPRNPARSPRVRVFCLDPELKAEYLDGAKAVVAMYRKAIGGFLEATRRGRRVLIKWPAWTYPPSSMVPVAP
jgi:REP element-mobilizing transposase RayT